MKSLEDLGVNIKWVSMPYSKVIFIMKSGAQMEFNTPLTSEDMLMLWSKRKKYLKLPAGEHSYIVVKKKNIDLIKTRFLSGTEDSGEFGTL